MFQTSDREEEPKAPEHLDLHRCPRCRADRPTLVRVREFTLTAKTNRKRRRWVVYGCAGCGGAIMGEIAIHGGIGKILPETPAVDKAIPDRARAYLEQALDALRSPAGCVMLCASAVDAMLKFCGYRDGSLYARIDEAAADNRITSDMAKWAHEVRLDANAQRHSDEAAPLPTHGDAERCVAFASALGDYMFVLPTRVKRERARKPT